MSVRLFPLPTSDAAMRRRMSGAEISFGVGENRRGYAAMRHIRARKGLRQRRYYDAGRTKKEERKEKSKYNKIGGRQNRYVKTGIAKKARQKRVSRAPAFHVNNLLNIGRPKGTFLRKREGSPSIQALFCEFCRTLSEKTLGIKPTKRPTERPICLRRYRPSASSHRFARCKTDSRRRPSGIAPKLCDSFARQAGGWSPSKRAYVKTVCRFACKESGRDLPPSKRNCADSAHRLKYGGARRGPRFRRKTGVRKLPRGCEKQQTRTKRRAGTVD